MFEQIGTVLERVLEEKRARVPVRGYSYERGRCEGRFWRKTSRQEVRRILLAAKRYELTLRRKGRRSGPLGSVAIEVLEYFVNRVDFRTGRLEPSLDTLMRRLKRSRDAIVRALSKASPVPQEMCLAGSRTFGCFGGRLGSPPADQSL